MPSRTRIQSRSTQKLQRIAVALIVLGLVGSVAPAGAAPLPSGVTITPLTASRSIFAEGTSFCPGCGPMGEDEIFSNQDSDSSDTLGLFDSSVSSVGSDAFQDSTISTNELSGLLGIGLGFTGDNSANSLLSTTFQVDTSGVYALAGLFSGAEDVMNITLSSISGTLLDLDGSGLGPFYQEFSLSAGETYTLEASLAGSDFSGFGRGASIDFTFGVPEPTTAVLIGLGLLLTGMRRRR